VSGNYAIPKQRHTSAREIGSANTSKEHYVAGNQHLIVWKVETDGAGRVTGCSDNSNIAPLPDDVEVAFFKVEIRLEIRRFHSEHCVHLPSGCSSEFVFCSGDADCSAVSAGDKLVCFAMVRVAVSIDNQSDVFHINCIRRHRFLQAGETFLTRLVDYVARVNQYVRFAPRKDIGQQTGVAVVAHSLPYIAVQAVSQMNGTMVFHRFLLMYGLDSDKIDQLVESGIDIGMGIVLQDLNYCPSDFEDLVLLG
jgi:hypothetical protein